MLVSRLVMSAVVAAMALVIVGCTEPRVQTPLENVQIVERSPGVSENPVPIGSPVMVIFNVDMNADTINADTLTLVDNDTLTLVDNDTGSSVLADVDYDATNRRAILTPATVLMHGTTYLATVTADVRSANGGTLGGVPAPSGIPWSFRTAEVLVGSAYANSITGVGAAMTPLSAKVEGGMLPYAFVLRSGVLPSGVALDPGTGVISGTPTAVGPFVGTVRVTEGAGEVADLGFDITVTAGGVPPVPLVGSAYANSITGVGAAMTPLSPDVAGGTTPYAFALTADVLPPGVALDPATGVISGTPTAVGPFVGTVRVTDAEGAVAVLAFDILVTAEVVVPDPLVGSAYAASSTVVGSAMTPLSPDVAGGTTPYAFAVTAGALPPGVALDPVTGVISGTPTDVGPFVGTVRVTDVAGVFANLGFDITVTSAPSLPLGLSYARSPYAYDAGFVGEIVPASDVVVVNADGTLIFEWFRVTPNLNDSNWSIDGATGAIRRQDAGGPNNDRPIRNGDRTYEVTVRDASGATATFLVEFTVNR